MFTRAELLIESRSRFSVGLTTLMVLKSQVAQAVRLVDKTRSVLACLNVALSHFDKWKVALVDLSHGYFVI